MPCRNSNSSDRSAQFFSRLTGLALLCLLGVVAPRARAAFHLWQVQEIFSSSDASVQFVELHNNFTGENSVGGFTLTANSDGNVKTFTFPASPAGETANHNLLIATNGFGSLPGGVTPNFTFAQGGVSGNFFNPSATNLTITFSGSGDALSFAGSLLPKDGVHSLTDGNLYAAPVLTPGVNSPSNLAGQTGSVNVAPEPGAAVLLAIPSAVLLRRRRRYA